MNCYHFLISTVTIKLWQAKSSSVFGNKTFFSFTQNYMSCSEFALKKRLCTRGKLSHGIGLLVANVRYFWVFIILLVPAKTIKIASVDKDELLRWLVRITDYKCFTALEFMHFFKYNSAINRNFTIALFGSCAFLWIETISRVSFHHFLS